MGIFLLFYISKIGNYRQPITFYPYFIALFWIGSVIYIYL